MKFIYVLSMLMLVLGCHQKHQSHVPEGIINKQLLDGEWYTKATIVAKQSHNSFGFTGMECPVDRIKFVITKDKLLAYRSYERGQNSIKSPRDQNLVAAFRITHHVNSNNVINKIFHEVRDNWAALDSIVVDWSENLSPHLECNNWLQSITRSYVKNTGLNNPRDPFRVRVEKSYIETTIDALVKPDAKACALAQELNCHGAEYRVKFSFQKIDHQNDYQKMNYPDAEPLLFGTNDQGLCLPDDVDCHDIRELWLYSDALKTTLCDPLKHNMQNCFLPTIKMNSRFGFFRTMTQEYDRKYGFSRRNRVQLINRWNIWQKSVDENRAIIPLSNREPRKIVYYLNPGFPEALMPAMRDVETEWNRAFKNVVTQVKNKLPSANARDHRKSDIQATMDVYGNMFEIKRNDCNQENIQLYAKENNLQQVLLEQGIASITDDNMEIACAILEWASIKMNLPHRFSWQQIGDLRFSFINGITKPDAGLLGYGPAGVDPITGEIISATANIYLASITEYAHKSALTLDALDELSKTSTTLDSRREVNTDPVDMDRFNTFVKQTMNSMTQGSYKSKRLHPYQSNNFIHAGELQVFNSFKGWSLSEWQSAFKESGQVNEAENLIAMMTEHLTSDQTKINLARRREKEQFFSERSACFFHALEKMPLVNISQQLKDLSLEDRTQYIKSQIVAAVAKHELGHNFGLRHNFKGAFDALNYPPQFWKVHDHKNDHLSTKNLAPEELRSSSIMDYHKHFNSNFSGVGLYDYAALLFGYGGLLEVFDTEQENFVPPNFIDKLSLMDYHDLPYLFAGNNANKILLDHYLEIMDQNRQGKTAHLALSALNIEPRADNFYKRKVVDYSVIKKQRLLSILTDQNNEFTEVPYAFCTDGQAMQQDISCQPFIFGSSASEIIESAIHDYELALWLKDQGHQTLPSDLASYLSYVYNNVYLPILRTYQLMYATNQDYQIFSGIYDLMAGTKKGLDFISRVLQSVTPGWYCKNVDGNYELSTTNCDDAIVVNDRMGQKYQSSFDASLKPQLENIGYIYDKILALLVLIDDDALVDHEFSTWERNDYSIGFYRIFTPQLTKIFADLYLEKWEGFSPWVVDNKIVYRDLFNLDDKARHLPKIQASSSSILRDYAILFSIAGLSNPLDHKLDFAKRAHIDVIKNSSPTSSDMINQTTFKDPNTGIQYRALSFDSEDLSPGFLLLQDAQRFVSSKPSDMGPWYLAKSTLVDLDKKIASHLTSSMAPDDMEDLANAFHVAKKNFARRQQELNEKVKVIEKVSRLSKQFID